MAEVVDGAAPEVAAMAKGEEAPPVVGHVGAVEGEGAPPVSVEVGDIEREEEAPPVAEGFGSIEGEKAAPVVGEVGAIEGGEMLPVSSEVGAIDGKEAEPEASELKRKHEDLGDAVQDARNDRDEATMGDGGGNGVEEKVGVQKVDVAVEVQEDVKRPRVEALEDVSDVGVNQEGEKKEGISVVENGSFVPSDNTEKPVAVEGGGEATVLPTEHGEASYAHQLMPTSRKIEIPNSKVGVLIGKAGDTIKFLQYNSGAKIQITRDADTDPHSSTRPVELIGNVECINKAEQLIKDVIAEAEAGGSPALVARGFGTAQPGAEQLEIQVPNEKVGVIIGKGGDTIKSLQTRSGARIQLIPQHLPEGDSSRVRTVRISGNKKHIETATEMIQEVMNQPPGRSSLSTGYNQQSYRPRGPAPPQWGPRAMYPSQPPSGYDYPQRGMHPSQTQNYIPAHGGYQQQPPPRGGGGYGGSWDQRPPVQAPQAGGYDYYGQGVPPTDSQSSGHLSAPNASGPTPSQGGGYYGQPQGSGYGQPAPYPQSMATQQNYAHGYANEPKYDAHAQGQPMYGQQPLGAQPGPYAQVGAAQYQQPYSRPPYGGVSSQAGPQSYGQPRPSQPGDQIYQAPPPAYGAGGQTQQPYPYVSGAQPVPAYNQQQQQQPYGGASTAVDGGYMQQSSGYAQPGVPAAGYAQAGRAAPTYPQVAQSGAYGQYQQTQPSYTEQSVPSSVPGYGYQQGAPAEVPAAHGSSTPSSAYATAAPTAGQAGYVQPPANPSGYEQQSAPPAAAYGSYPGSAPGSYT